MIHIPDLYHSPMYLSCVCFKDIMINGCVQDLIIFPSVLWPGIVLPKIKYRFLNLDKGYIRHICCEATWQWRMAIGNTVSQLHFKYHLQINRSTVTCMGRLLVSHNPTDRQTPSSNLYSCNDGMQCCLFVETLNRVAACSLSWMQDIVTVARDGLYHVHVCIYGLDVIQYVQIICFVMGSSWYTQG